MPETQEVQRYKRVATKPAETSPKYRSTTGWRASML